MALINCPECGNSISDKAEKCPHCGVPAKYFSEDVTNSKKIPVVTEIKNGYTIIYVNSETAKCLQYLIDEKILDSDSITINPSIQTF